MISPTSDTEEFIISATPESVMIGTRMKSGELYLRKAMISIGDEDMAIITKGYLRLTGSQHLSLTSANDIVLFPGVSMMIKMYTLTMARPTTQYCMLETLKI